MRTAGHRTAAVESALWLLLCLAAGPAAADFTNTMTVRGELRRYIVHVPPSYDGSKAYPVLLMFHGWYSTAEQAASSYYDWTTSADSNRFIAVFPDSITPPGKDIEFPPGTILYDDYDGTGKRWDIAHVFSNRLDSQDVEFTGSILDWLEANYNVRTSHVFTTGHSYGAFFSYYLSVCLSNRVSAFGEHSGGLKKYDVIPGVWTIWWPIDVPTIGPDIEGFLLHSTDDGTVPYADSVLLDAQMTLHGHDHEFITLTGLGHGWDKTKNQDQWDFFLAHSPVIDDDADGMPDPWEYATGLNDTTNDAALDADGDRMSNIGEYLSGTHPKDSNSVFRIESGVDLGPGGFVVSWSSVAGKTYVVDRSTNLLSGFTNIASSLAATAPVNAYTDSPPAVLSVYYRVGVE